MIEINVDIDLDNADWPKQTDDRLEYGNPHYQSITKAFDPNQPRGDDGRWIDAGRIRASASDPSAIAGLLRDVTDPGQRRLLARELRESGMQDGDLRQAEAMVVDGSEEASTPSSDRRAAESALTDRMEQALSGPRARILLTEDQRVAYAQAMASAASKLTDKALERVNKNLDNILVYSDSRMLARSIYGKDTAKVVGGAVEMLIQDGELRSATIHADGGYGLLSRTGEPSVKDGSTTEEIYLHELTHLVDFVPKGEITFSGSRLLSDSGKWKEAWEREVGTPDKPLSDYAATNPKEGFAEFGRYLFRNPGEAQSAFPACYGAWSEFGLLGDNRG